MQHLSPLRFGACVAIVAITAGCTSAPSPTSSPAATTALVPTVPAQTALSTAAVSLPTASSAVATPSAVATAAAPSPTALVSPTPGATQVPTPGPTPTLAPSPSIPASTNLVEVLAGGGTADPSAGGNATDARLVHPTGLGVAGNGTIGIVDSSAETLLAVGPDGMIAVAAEGLTGPQGMCLAFEGVPFVADRGANRVVTTNGNGGLKAVAGSEFHPAFRGDGGPAKKAYLSQPYDVACDAAGNLYIADTSNARVRFIDAQTGEISTIAGNGTQGYAGDGGLATDAELTSPQGLAVDSAGTVLFIADYGDSHVRRVDLATGIITTVVGSGASAVAYNPNLTALQVAPTRLITVAIDAQGNIYLPVFFSDLGQVVARVDSTGNLSIVAGGGTISDVGIPATDFRVPSVESLEIEPATGALLIASNDGRVYRIPGVATPVT